MLEIGGNDNSDMRQVGRPEKDVEELVRDKVEVGEKQEVRIGGPTITQVRPAEKDTGGRVGEVILKR